MKQRWIALVPAVAALIIWLPDMALSTDFLNPARLVQAKFNISVNNDKETVAVWMTFRGDGLQLLPPGGRVSVNDVSLVPERIGKQGHSYKGVVKRSSKYTLQYVLAAGQPLRTHEFPDRRFEPGLPPLIRRSQGFEVPFAGAPVEKDEAVFAELVGGQGPTRWGAVLQAIVERQQLLFPSSAMAESRLGGAELYVGVTRRSRVAAEKLYALHSVGTARIITLAD